MNRDTGSTNRKAFYCWSCWSWLADQNDFVCWIQNPPYCHFSCLWSAIEPYTFILSFLPSSLLIKICKWNLLLHVFDSEENDVKTIIPVAMWKLAYHIKILKKLICRDKIAGKAHRCGSLTTSGWSTECFGKIWRQCCDIQASYASESRGLFILCPTFY